MTALTYLLQIEAADRLVKFGRTRNPISRMASLKTGFPWPLRLVALIGADVERALMHRFASDKVQGEWFRPSLELRDWLREMAEAGKLIRQVPVDQAYVNAVIKPRILEYLKGREPHNNPHGDLVRLILADLLPSMAGREKDLVAATQGHVTESICRGFGPTMEVPRLDIPEVDVSQRSTADSARR